VTAPCRLLPSGSFQKGEWSRHPEAEVTARIVDDNQAIFDNFG